MDRYLYISHSHKDTELMDDLVRFLDEQNFSHWSDQRDMLGGTLWKDEIERKIADCTLFLFVVTQNSIKSQFLSEVEVPQAFQYKKTIIPIVDDQFDVSELPDWSKDILIIRFPSEKEKLKKSIFYYLNKEPQEAAQNQTKVEKENNSNLATSESAKQQYDQSATKVTDSNANDNSLPLPEDKTPFHKDTPSNIDYLGRKGFVEALAEWIDRYWMEYQTAEKSFTINIHGQWGAGKTTFLNLLQKELQGGKSSNDWIVVWFNAWENRHIRPEWWPLMDKIYRDFVAQKKANKEKKVWQIELQEWWWRFYSGRKWELLGFIASAVLLLFIFYWVMRTGFFPEKDFMTRVEGVAKSIGLVFSAVSTIFLGTRFVSQTLSTGSAKAAEVYLQLTPDPIENIKWHFNNLIENKINNPVIVFIDDLDRCDREYLVNLLESVQTILNHKKVFYVVAADQRWLFAAFEETYKEFKDSVKEPGKKIGYLFLEKIFQLSMSIPNISNEARAVYLDYLLGKEEQIEAKRAQIKKDMESVEKNDQAYIGKIQSQPAGTIEKVLMREVVVSKMASLEIEKATTQHFLSNFAHLMDPNPRGIKRLVTFYGVLRAMAILTDENIVADLKQRNQLALWTIVKMRWPLLADYLEEYPQYLINFKAGRSIKAIHADVKDLIKDQDVMNVLSGNGINVELDSEALKRFTSLKATERTF